jgi:hypothetical protein
MADPSVLQIALMLLAPGGLAAAAGAGAVKLVLNGTKQKVEQIDERTKTTHQAVKRLHERVDTLELEAAFEKGKEAMRRELSQE